MSAEALRGPNSDAHYSRAPMNEYDPYTADTGPGGVPAKKRTSPWVKYGIPVALLIVLGAVLGGVLGTQLNKNDKAAASGSNGSGGGNGNGGGDDDGDGSSNSPGGTATAGLFATATNSYYQPIYPTADNAQAYVAPTFAPTASVSAAWPTDTFAPAQPVATSVRPDRPRLIAPAYKWAALPSLIEKDAYLKSFHDRIIANATAYLALPLVPRIIDGGSGMLDISREIKLRVKAWAYSYRATNDKKFLDAAWRELRHASNNDPQNPFGGDDDPWNQSHFLDVAEMTSAFAIGYDWLYDAWSDDQRNVILWAIINIGLAQGLQEHESGSWWTGSGGRLVAGNWNCVCNGGLTMGALAVLGDDTTGRAASLLSKTIPNANANCVFGPSDDGSWRETPNYWYFGTTGHAEMASSLLTATGGEYGILTTNPSFNLTALYHIYVTGMTSLFDYADHGPNKFSSTANSVMFYGQYYSEPRYTLYQRDRFDSADPYNMFWYEPSVRGAWWNGLPLDREFSDPDTSWAAMRSSWTDINGLYVAMKSSKLTGHQAHGDLDCGDFALDAMGERWAGELGSGDYLSPQYFNSEADNAARWLYYRKRTEGQNTLVLGGANQLADEASPTFDFGSSGETQGSSPVAALADGSTAFMRTDMSSAYGGGASVVRGIRLLNQRRQVLLQDDVSSSGAAVMWRMHTNATVAADGATATLKLGDKTLVMRLLSPAGVGFETMQATRLPGDPALPSTAVDQQNPDVTVVVINVPAGESSIQVLFDPLWDGASTQSVTPPTVPVASWTVTSHNS